MICRRGWLGSRTQSPLRRVRAAVGGTQAARQSFHRAKISRERGRDLSRCGVTGSLVLDRHGRVSVGEDRFHALNGQPRVGGEEFVQVRVRGQVPQNELNRNACSLDDRLANHDLGIFNDPIVLAQHLFRHGVITSYPTSGEHSKC